MTEHPAEGFREGRRDGAISIDRCNASRENGNAIRSDIAANRTLLALFRAELALVNAS